MQVALPELNIPVTLILNPEGIGDDDYMAFCQANPICDWNGLRKGRLL